MLCRERIEISGHEIHARLEYVMEPKSPAQGTTPFCVSSWTVVVVVVVSNEYLRTLDDCRGCMRVVAA